MRQRGEPTCETCEGDGYADIVDESGAVLGPAPCPRCDDLNEGLSREFNESILNGLRDA